MTALHAMNRMRAAGFVLELDGDALVVSPADELSDEQRAFIRDNKPALVQLLTDETAPPPPPPPRPAEVTCCDCRHGQPATPADPYCWHRCAAGVERATGWGMAARKCERWEVNP